MVGEEICDPAAGGMRGGVLRRFALLNNNLTSSYEASTRPRCRLYDGHILWTRRTRSTMTSVPSPESDRRVAKLSTAPARQSTFATAA